jgi:hypothetical protein
VRDDGTEETGLRASTLALFAVLAAACSASETDAPSVVLDGLFDEWTEASTLIDDPPDTRDAVIDLLSVQALDDGQWLYLALDVGNEVSLQALPGTLHLLLDADADRGTGVPLYGMDGVDLVVDLAASVVPQLSPDQRLGFGLRAIDERGELAPIERHGLGLIAAPTWSAPRFELRLARRGADGSAALGAGLRIKAVYEEEGSILDDTEVGSYRFATRAAEDAGMPQPEVVALRLQRPAGSTRVAAWNVSRNSFTDRATGFVRVLAALAPDVVLLDELPPELVEEELEALFASGPLGELGPWSFALGQPSLGQKAAVAARGATVTPAPGLLDVPYPEGSLEALAERVDAPWLEYLLGQEERRASTAGGWVELGGTPVLFVAVDLQAAGWAGSPRDRMRVLETAAIRDRVAQVLVEKPGPVVIGGDLNLVGSRTPLFQLLRQLDVDGSDLVPVDAVRLGERTLATWRNERDPFAPGRLDFLLVPDAVVTIANSFVFATEDLDDTTLSTLGLERELMAGLSDHLVVVADLLINGTTP